MAQKGVQLDRENFSCSICLDLLKDPVTTSCGHSYCMNCIKSFWDGEEEKKIYSCPQCRQTFPLRPVLLKNTMLAALVEELMKTGLQDAPADHCYAGPEDVACDFCTGRKLKAFKSCLVCLVSYCEKHLQPHYGSSSFENHKLVEPFKTLKENICPRHNEVMKMFCRTDQQCICYLCSVEEHKGHDTVSAAEERTERQRELKGRRQNIQQRIQDREEDVKVLQQEVKNINCSADKAVEDSEKMLTELIRLMEKRRSDVKQQVRSQQQTEVSRVLELQKKLEQEINELKRKDAELKKLSHTEDHNQFLHNYPSVSALSEATHSSSINIRPLRHFEDVTAAVTEVRDKLQDVLTQTWTNISQTVMRPKVLRPRPEPQPEPKTRAEFLKYSREITLDPNTANTLLSQTVMRPKVLLQQLEPQPEPKTRAEFLKYARKITLDPNTANTLLSQTVMRPKVLLQQLEPQPEPKTRAEFLKYSREITLDPNTAYKDLLLSDGNRKVTRMRQDQSYCYHPDRFTYWPQVLSRQSLTGRCYWEVEWREGGVYVAVTYKNISRAGWSDESEFGRNDKSWVLDCNSNSHRFRHNKIGTEVSYPRSSRVGVYLDHRAGILSFYSVSETMTLLHRVQTTFTQPLYAGLFLYNNFSRAEFIKLK